MAEEKNWCAEHETTYFKKGGMKGYAHPIGDTGKWCNKPKEVKGEDTPDTSQQATTALPSQEKGATHPVVSTDKSRSIEKQVSLKAAVELAVSGVIDRLTILKWADIFDRWLGGDNNTIQELYNQTWEKDKKAP